MPNDPLTRFVGRLRTVAAVQAADDTPDGELLDRFARAGEEAAFAALLCRHGPMVRGVCRRLLGNDADVDDAFQAVFLLLVRKAASVRPPGRVGGWLHGVARRTALEARRRANRRRAAEGCAAPRPEPTDDPWAELRPRLDAEIARLPDNYRAALVLCDLEGCGRKEAARRLGVPEGTAASRLARARALLARRLAKYGAVSGAVVAAVVSREGRASVPAGLTASTMSAAAGGVSAGIASLAKGVTQAMWLTKTKTAAVVLGLLGAAVFAGAAAVGGRGVASDKPAAYAKDRPKAPPERTDERGPAKDDKFITKAGEYKVGGNVTIKVTEPEAGKILWETVYGRPGGSDSTRPTEPDVRKESPWFIYPQSPDAIWIFDGDDGLLWVGREDILGEKGVKVRIPVHLPAGWPALLVKDPPKDLLERLPEKLRPREKPEK